MEKAWSHYPHNSHHPRAYFYLYLQSRDEYGVLGTPPTSERGLSFDDQAVIIGLIQTEKRNIKIQKAQPEKEKKIWLCDIKSTKLIINF